MIRGCKHFLFFSAIWFLQFYHGFAQCPGPSSLDYARIFIIKSIGDGNSQPTTEENHAQALLGSCSTLEAYKDTVIAWFQDMYGLNVNVIKSGPLKVYETDDFTIRPWGTKEGASDYLVTASLYDHATYLNERHYWFKLLLSAKKEINGPKGNILPNQRIGFGIERFKDQGKDFCLRYHERVPRSKLPPGSTIYPLDLVYYHEELGQGAGRGLGRWEYGKSTWDYVITFPT